VSRAIQVRVSESITRTVHIEDGVAAPLEMLPILPPARMAELLGHELAGRGFVRTGSICRRIEPDGLEVAIDLEAATVTVVLGAHTKIDETATVAAAVAAERPEAATAAEAALRDEARRILDERVAARAASLQLGVTAVLEAKVADLRRELDQAIGRATVAALTEKAAQLGRIEETHLDEAGNLTIRVRL
jgi:hypothetical protein